MSDFKLRIPPRFEHATLGSFVAENSGQARVKKIAGAYVDKWEGRKALGAGILFCGSTGTGKTHLGYAIAREIEARYDEAVCVTTISRIIKLVRSSWQRNGSGLTEMEAIRFYSAFDLLVVDEIGVQAGSESERVILFDIVNRRYEYNLPTILISNLALDEVKQVIGISTFDRLMGNGCALAFDWPSGRCAYDTQPVILQPECDTSARTSSGASAVTS